MTSPKPSAGGTRLLRGAARHSTGRATGITVCSTASAAASLAEPAVLGHALDLLLARSSEATAWVALCTALIVADIALDAAAAHLTGTTNARSTAWVRGRSAARLLATAPERAARFAPGDLATRLNVNAAEAGTLPAVAAGAFATLLLPLGAVIALFAIDLWTAAAFLAGLPLLVLLLRSFARHSSDSVSRYQQVQGDIADRLVESLSGAWSVAAAGTAGRERARVLAPLAELTGHGRRMWRVHGRAVARSGVLMPSLVCLVLAVGGLRLEAGAIGVGALVAASRYAALAAGFGAAAGVLAALVRGRSAARRVRALAELPATRHGLRSLPPAGGGALELRGVVLHRDGAPVLRGIDLLVPGGTTAAVVGRSGSGKSALAAVAGRLTDPDHGTVLLDGVPLAALTHEALRGGVGYAFSRPSLFGRTVGDALAFGDRAPSEAALRAAARAACAEGFVQRLPAGFRTRLSEAPLSGGEFQRLGLARAFAHAGRLLILDDATSSLDTVTEREVQRALTDQVGGGTRLVVAHRPSSAARADLVVWLDDGRVRAVGTHRTLWRHPAYRAVFASAGPAVGPGPDPARGPATGPHPGPPPGAAGPTRSGAAAGRVDGAAEPSR